MARRLLSAVLVVCAGCWADDRVDGLTPAQWDYFREQFRVRELPDPCVLSTGLVERARCDELAKLGQQLFFEPALSGPDVGGGKVACSTCHAATWYADTRFDNALSLGATGYTKHNTISLADIAFKRDLYTWTGQCANRDCSSPSDVIEDIALPKAMKSSPKIVCNAITTAYARVYEGLFGALPMTCDTDASVQHNVEIAFDAYMRRLLSIEAPFDEFIRGQDDAIDAAARRGFVVFVRNGCADCHGGPMLSDGLFHVTGVEDATLDNGRNGSGEFFTASLRHVAKTAPYMHNGSLATLGDVVTFYRWGGAASGFIGEKDARIAPLDISDDDAQDLVAFLQTLTGAPIDPALRADTHCTGACP